MRFVDVGCGFGGLTVTLAALFPDKLVLGLEIRAKVCVLCLILNCSTIKMRVGRIGL